MAYFSYTKKIDFLFVSKENHFKGIHHYVMNGTIKTLWAFRRENTSLKIIYSVQSNLIPLKVLCFGMPRFLLFP